jgi:hypothetical protein
MTRTFVLVALAFGSTLTASAAAATSDAERYVACLAETQPARVHELLQAGSNVVANRPYRELTDDVRCFAKVFDGRKYRPAEASLPMDMLRGKLAEHALLNAASQVAALQPLPLQQKRYIRPWFAATGRNAAIDEMGACMADIDPASIVALIRTEPASSSEDSAIGAMSPALTKCLSAGIRLEATRAALRAALADALYERLNNPAMSQADVKGTAQ